MFEKLRSKVESILNNEIYLDTVTGVREKILAHQGPFRIGFWVDDKIVLMDTTGESLLEALEVDGLEDGQVSCRKSTEAHHTLRVFFENKEV